MKLKNTKPYSSLMTTSFPSLHENNSKTLTSNDIDDINLWLYIKDKFNISDQAWKELAIKCLMKFQIHMGF